MRSDASYVAIWPSRERRKDLRRNGSTHVDDSLLDHLCGTDASANGEHDASRRALLRQPWRTGCDGEGGRTSIGTVGGGGCGLGRGSLLGRHDWRRRVDDGREEGWMGGTYQCKWWVLLLRWWRWCCGCKSGGSVQEGPACTRGWVQGPF